MAKVLSNEKGIALIAALILLLVLTLIGSTAVTLITTDIQIGGNYKIARQSFNYAEAGVQYALAQIRNKYKAGPGHIDMSANPLNIYYAPGPTTDFPVQTGRYPFNNYTASHLSLRSTTLKGNTYLFRTTGKSSDSSTTLEVLMKIPSPIVYGVFANGTVDVKNNGTFNSFDSRTVFPPHPPDYTSNADIGSNTSVDMGNHTDIKGDLILGGSASDLGGGTVSGTRGLRVQTVDPDPLDVASLVAANNYSLSNNNSSLGIPIPPSPQVLLVNSSITRNVGPGKYYFTNFQVNGTLNITGSGPVNIYVDGDFILKRLTISGSGPVNIYLRSDQTTAPRPSIDVQGTELNKNGIPTNLAIYCNMIRNAIPSSNELFDFDSKAVLNGLLYAPNTDIKFKNDAGKGEVNGMLWGRSIDIKNNFDFLFDKAMETKFSGITPTIIRWKELF